MFEDEYRELMVSLLQVIAFLQSVIHIQHSKCTTVYSRHCGCLGFGYYAELQALCCVTESVKGHFQMCILLCFTSTAYQSAALASEN